MTADQTAAAAPPATSDQTARIVEASVHCNVSLDRTEAAVSVVLVLASPERVPAYAVTEIDLDGLPVATIEDAVTVRGEDTVLVQSCAIPRVQLWWPHGMGSQKLYRARTALVCRDGTLLDRCAIQFGIRQADADFEEGAGCPRIRLNGQEVRCIGRPAPASVMADDDWEQHLALLVSGGGNTLLAARCVLPEAAFDRCDRLGILVLQQAPAEGIEQAAARIRRHPSLLAWVLPAENPEDARSELEMEDPLRLILTPDQAQSLLARDASAGSDGDPGFRVTADFGGDDWSAADALTADVWLHNSGAPRSLLNAVATVTDPDGNELYQENLAGEAPSGVPERVGDLYWRFPRDFRGPFVLSLEVIDEEGETLATASYRLSR